MKGCTARQPHFPQSLEHRHQVYSGMKDIFNVRTINADDRPVVEQVCFGLADWSEM